MTKILRHTAVVAGLLVFLAGVPLMSAVAALGATPRDADVDTQKGTELVEKFFTLLEKQDEKGLGRFVSPAFQIQRADGSSLDRDQYLANPATVEDFEITNVNATKTGNVYVVRYDAVGTITIDGVPQKTSPAPRLSVFVKTKKSWQIVAHANFNTPQTPAQ